MGQKYMFKTRFINKNFDIFQIVDAIKGTMTEIYNDLSQNTSGNTIAEVCVNASSNCLQEFTLW